MDATERLAKHKNRATLYELTISDGERAYLVCYSSKKSRGGLRDAVTKPGRVERVMALTGAENLTFARKAADGATMGGWSIRFSGRTEREAIGAGELSPVPDVPEAEAPKMEGATTATPEPRPAPVPDPAPVRPQTARQPTFEVVEHIRFAGQLFRKSQIAATLGLLRYYTDFLASPLDRCKDPEDPFRSNVLSKDKAQRRMKFLIDVAINRKAGIPDVACRKQEVDYQARLYRDCRAVREAINRRIVVRRFETPEILRRYAHLLTID